MSIGSRIKELRENKNISRNELAELLGVTVGAISNYENEVSSPKEPILFKIMEVLNCDANYLFQDAINMPTMENTISVGEYDIIKKYRSLDAPGQNHVNAVIEWESDRVKSLQEAHEHTASLEALLDGHPEMRMYAYLRKVACAGTGFYFDDIPADTIEAPYMEGADFVIGVSGDSMEPDYHDGDMLYIKKMESLNIGDVGIFTINNECFLKEYGKSGLISKNNQYKDIAGSEDVRLIGKVIGKVKI